MTSHHSVSTACDSRGHGRGDRGRRSHRCSDIDGRPVEPGDPEARTHTGIVDSVHRHRDDSSRVVAYLVRCRGGVSGTYFSTVLPEHRPTVVES
ncbi:hypothetical protein C5E51_34545 [Nocardia nova]|nr:hypothetical protein C5E51_34545 [Nocardia nova]